MASSFDELQLALSPRHIYSTIGVLLVSLGLYFASKVNRVNEGEPPLLPGAIPIFGHALTFLKDNNKIYKAARDWSPDSHPVSLSLAGKRLYVVLNPKDVSATWRAKTLDFEGVVRWGLHKIFTMSKDGTEKLSHDYNGEGSLYADQHVYWRDALAPGEALDNITQRFLRWLEVDFADIEQELEASPTQEMTVNLRSWCRDRMGIPSTNAIMGPQMLEHEPKMLEYVTEVDKNFFKLALGLPRWIIRSTYDARETLIKTFMKCGLINEEILSSMKIRRRMMESRGIDNRDQAVVFFSLWSATQANVNPTMFWLLYEILLHPKERALIEQEIAPAFSPSPSDPNAEVLTDLSILREKAPMLNSMYWEALRYASCGMSTRQVMEDTYVNGWKFVKGSTVMIPLRTNHYDPKLYGERINEFVADRFISDFQENGNVVKKGPTMKTMKPFGGGNTLCPGRHFAANESFAFVASALRKLDIQLVEGQKEARPLTTVPSTGVYPPDQKILITIRPKKVLIRE